MHVAESNIQLRMLELETWSFASIWEIGLSPAVCERDTTRVSILVGSCKEGPSISQAKCWWRMVWLGNGDTVSGSTVPAQGLQMLHTPFYPLLHIWPATATHTLLPFVAHLSFSSLFLHIGGDPWPSALDPVQSVSSIMPPAPFVQQKQFDAAYHQCLVGELVVVRNQPHTMCHSVLSAAVGNWPSTTREARTCCYAQCMPWCTVSISIVQMHCFFFV